MAQKYQWNILPAIIIEVKDREATYGGGGMAVSSNFWKFRVEQRVDRSLHRGADKLRIRPVLAGASWKTGTFAGVHRKIS